MRIDFAAIRGVINQNGKAVAKPAKAHQKNLDTIIAAAKDGDLALVECQLKSTGEVVAVLTAISFDGKEYTMSPFAVMLNGNPYEMLNPPDPNGGFIKN